MTFPSISARNGRRASEVQLEAEAERRRAGRRQFAQVDVHASRPGRVRAAERTLRLRRRRRRRHVGSRRPRPRQPRRHPLPS